MPVLAMNTASTLLIIMAHKEGQATFDRHCVHWAYHRAEILVFCPRNSIVQTSWPVLAIGTASHHDAMANWRFRQLFEVLERTIYDNFFLLEYDAICFHPELPLSYCGQINANLWQNTEPLRFKGSTYLHPPLAFSKDILKRINKAARTVPDSESEGFWDRQLGLWCDIAKVPPAGWNERGFSRNTIQDSDIPSAVTARKAGAFLFHGIKTLNVLNALMNA
jgi:hypothetical protein